MHTIIKFILIFLTYEPSQYVRYWHSVLIIYESSSISFQMGGV